MKLLVTGAKGQVGSAICRLGTASGFEIIGLDSSMLNIADPAAIRNALVEFKPDLLINAAAYTAVDMAETEPEKAEQINGLSVGYLAEATAKKNIPLIHISTDYVFDGNKNSPYVETDPVAPLGIYGATKFHGERLVQQFNGRSIILRTSWVFGIEGKNFPKTMLRLSKERSEIGVVADQIGCPTFADDIAKTIFIMASKYQRSDLIWGLYHYAGYEACSWYDFADYILCGAKTNGIITSIPYLKALTTAQYPTAAKRPANSVLDCSKLLLVFPEISLSDWRRGVDSLLALEKTQF